VISNHIVNEINWQWARQTDTTAMSQAYTPGSCNARQSVLGVDTLGCARYTFPGFSWGYSQCLKPCLQSPGTTTPFKDIIEALSISQGSHNFKFGGDYSNYKTHEFASPTPFGVWSFTTISSSTRTIRSSTSTASWARASSRRRGRPSRETSPITSTRRTRRTSGR